MAFCAGMLGVYGKGRMGVKVAVEAVMDKPATLFFQGELQGLLHGRGREGFLRYPVTRAASIKDVIEALGVPHTEVYAIVANGQPVDFGYRLSPGEDIIVAPAVFPIDVTHPTLLRPTPFAKLRFVVDANAGRLATWLRLLGFDAAYAKDREDAALAELAAAEGRVVLTRDRTCLKRAKIVYGRVIRANDPVAQLRDVLRAFGLAPPYAAFTRCLRCNLPLTPVDKASVLDKLLPKTKKYYETFSQCPACGRIYWAGSHFEHMRAWIGQLTGNQVR